MARTLDGGRLSRVYSISAANGRAGMRGLGNGAFIVPSNISNNSQLAAIASKPVSQRTPEEWNLLNAAYAQAQQQGFIGYGVENNVPVTYGNTNINPNLSPSPSDQSQANNVITWPASAKLSNLTRPGSTFFYIGDAYRLTVTGEPNKSVVATGGRLGEPYGTKTLGSTNAQGIFHLDGVYNPGDIGTWYQAYSVAGRSAGSLNIQVNLISNGTGQNNQQSITNPQTNPPPTQGGNAGNGNVVGNSAVNVDFLKDEYLNVPVWMWLAAGAFGVYHFATNR